MADLKISQLTGATTPLAGTEVVPLVQSSTTKKVSVDNLTAGREVTSKNLLELPRAGAVPTNGSVVTGLTLFNDQDNATSDGVRILFDHSYRVPGSQTRGAYAYSFGETAFAGSVGLKFGVTDTGVFRDSLYLKGNTDVEVLTGNLIQGTAAKGVNFTANTPAAGMTSQLLNWYEEGTWTPTDDSGASLTFTGTSNNCYYTRIGRTVTACFGVTYPTTANGSFARIGGLPYNSKSTADSVQGGFFVEQSFSAGATISLSSGSSSFIILTSGSVSIATNSNLSTTTLKGVIVYQI